MAIDCADTHNRLNSVLAFVTWAIDLKTETTLFVHNDDLLWSKTFSFIEKNVYP